MWIRLFIAIEKKRKGNVRPAQVTTNIQNLLRDTEIQEGVLDNDSREVATTIAGYIAKKLVAGSKRMICKEMLIANENSIGRIQKT